MASWPNARQWLFSLKAFAAAMLALYIALALGLARPYWAMATVYFVSHPLTGATRSKAAYRIAGTVLGATAAVATVPQLVNMPIVLMGAIALWISVLVYLSLLQRTPRSYVCLLAAYTLPIVALPAVSQPAQIFDIAVARIEEIVIGIVCAGLVGSVVFPAKVAPALRARADTWLSDAAAWASDILAGSPRADHSRHRLAADILQLDQLISQLAYDTEGGHTLRHARALRGRMTMLMPLLSSLDSVLQALRCHAAGIPADLREALAATAAWLAGDAATAPAAAPEGWRMLSGPDASGWHDRLAATAADQLQRLCALYGECRALQQGIGDHRTGTPLPRGEPAAEAAGHHHDHGMLLFGAVSSGLAVFCAGLLWIFSGWEDGASAVVVASIASCFFAAVDEPRRMAGAFVRWSAICLLISSGYLFLVVPHAHTFEALAALLALPYLGIGLLISRPGFQLIAMLLSVNTAAFANVQAVFDADFLAIFNTCLASAAAMVFAPLWSVAARPFGARAAARRLVRASWNDLARAATLRATDGDARLGARMLDRLGQLVPRLGAAGDPLSADGFHALQVGYCALALHKALPDLPPPARKPVRRVLAAVARHFRAQLRAGRRVPVAAGLAAAVGEAMAAVAASGRAQRGTLGALVVLQVTLLPLPAMTLSR
ncbi:putative transporter; Fusaric acid resistance domain [Cupriavidus taiwanensis]|uniref:FUSC family protein n=1 Tax=Cupriavidus taiwanensis TaxID=164546 RepID=UPI000E1AB6F4|nr:FUSC family protein [Cupriavidus taiwanensis]SOZ00919.1 putative transporter; Fusaric acid resistance domain [Cupriavidus taiwanensis]SOZ06657.1 putative transporter; Fusaric acid resistance domain [Cupriavidus taiwanensis]